MSFSLIKNIALIFFLIVQLLVIVTGLIIRYHFKAFSAPGDPKGKFIVNFMNLGSAVMIIIAGISLYEFLVSG